MQMYLHQEVADIRDEFGRDILSRNPAQKNRPLTRMGQVIEAGGKICIANKASFPSSLRGSTVLLACC
jgi:hypothetical protein